MTKITAIDRISNATHQSSKDSKKSEGEYDTNSFEREEEAKEEIIHRGEDKVEYYFPFLLKFNNREAIKNLDKKDRDILRESLTNVQELMLQEQARQMKSEIYNSKEKQMKHEFSTPSVIHSKPKLVSQSFQSQHVASSNQKPSKIFASVYMHMLVIVISLKQKKRLLKQLKQKMNM